MKMTIGSELQDLRALARARRAAAVEALRHRRAAVPSPAAGVGRRRPGGMPAPNAYPATSSGSDASASSLRQVGA